MTYLEKGTLELKILPGYLIDNEPSSTSKISLEVDNQTAKFKLTIEDTSSLSGIRNASNPRTNQQDNRQQLDSCGSYGFLMTTEAIGGIGNQMSMYSSLLVVSSMSGYMPRISEVSYCLTIQFQCT